MTTLGNRQFERLSRISVRAYPTCERAGTVGSASSLAARSVDNALCRNRCLLPWHAGHNRRLGSEIGLALLVATALGFSTHEWMGVSARTVRTLYVSYLRSRAWPMRTV